MTNLRFSLNENPWLFLLVFILVTIVANILVSLVLIVGFKQPRNASATGLWVNLLAHCLVIFVIVPFMMKFHDSSRPYVEYLSEIRLIQVQPVLKLILLGVTCYLFLALSQFAGTLIFRLSQGQAVDLGFIRSSFPVASEFPPNSWGFLGSLISIFEEILFRGIVLAMFLRFYDQPKAVLFSALVFGAYHVFNLLNGREPVWVAGQVVWASILGLFYGYLTLKTGSLLPAMLVHYLGNVLIYPLTAYLQINATIPVQTLYGIIFSLGAIPAILMSLWVRISTSWWFVSAKP